MHVICRRLAASIIERDHSICVIIALHQHRDRIFIAGMQICRKRDIINVSVGGLLILVQQRQKLCLTGRQRLRHVPDITPRLPAVREHHKPLAVLPWNQCKRLGNSLLKICRRLVRKRHQSAIMML